MPFNKRNNTFHKKNYNALCVLFGLEFTDNNVITAGSKLESYGDLEVCYNLSERNPILVPKERINYDPFTYKKCLSPAPPKTNEAESNILLKSDSQISQFVNAIFSHLKMAHNESYELKAVCIKDIFNTVKQYTDRFETETQFAQWTKSKVYYTHVPFSRKRQQSGASGRKRDIYVLKPEFHKTIANNIVSKLANYQQYLQNLKKDFLLIGYARKSVGHANYRDKNIQMMVNNLYNRCKVNKCYASYSSEASSSIESRDVKDCVETLAKLKNVNGNTQGIICI
ncbi:hypothetical protein G6F42_025188 [Rhizopus arrhizus]|nr:hypothetical protein G6F42_025188 [Rhizopus arrhizus]